MGVTTVIKDYGTDILNAIRENDLQTLKSILEKHLKFDRKIQKLCIADIKHKPTKKFACPLILAARQEDPKIIKYMLDKGADPNFVHHTIFSSKRREIVTCLHIAVDLGHLDTVDALLAVNADANIKDHNGETPLHIAVKKADSVMTRMLLSRGADPAVTDRRGNAALHIATQYGHLQLVRLLLKYDADVYQKGQSGAIPPHIAAKEGHIHLIQLFCSRDVGNINIKIPCYADKRAKAPIHLAAENGHVETVLALLDQFDAEVNLKDSDGNTPLHSLVINQYNPHRMRDKEYFNETARVLLKYKISYNEQNIWGDTALHLAAANHYQRIAELLIELGANPSVTNNEQLKPIDIVPDSDTVMKQILKNAMLNPRATLTSSTDTLRSNKAKDSGILTNTLESKLSRHSDGRTQTANSSSSGDIKSSNLLDQSMDSSISINSVFEENKPSARGSTIQTRMPIPMYASTGIATERHVSHIGTSMDNKRVSSVGTGTDRHKVSHASTGTDDMYIDQKETQTPKETQEGLLYAQVQKKMKKSQSEPKHVTMVTTVQLDPKNVETAVVNQGQDMSRAQLYDDDGTGDLDTTAVHRQHRKTSHGATDTSTTTVNQYRDYNEEKQHRKHRSYKVSASSVKSPKEENSPPFLTSEYDEHTKIIYENPEMWDSQSQRRQPIRDSDKHSNKTRATTANESDAYKTEEAIYGNDFTYEVSDPYQDQDARQIRPSQHDMISANLEYTKEDIHAGLIKAKQEEEETQSETVTVVKKSIDKDGYVIETVTETITGPNGEIQTTTKTTKKLKQHTNEQQKPVTIPSPKTPSSASKLARKHPPGGIVVTNALEDERFIEEGEFSPEAMSPNASIAYRKGFGFLQNQRQQQQNSEMISTPEASHWKVRSGVATTVKPSIDKVTESDYVNIDQLNKVTNGAVSGNVATAKTVEEAESSESSLEERVLIKASTHPQEDHDRYYRLTPDRLDQRESSSSSSAQEQDVTQIYIVPKTEETTTKMMSEVNEKLPDRKETNIDDEGEFFIEPLRQSPGSKPHPHRLSDVPEEVAEQLERDAAEHKATYPSKLAQPLTITVTEESVGSRTPDSFLNKSQDSLLSPDISFSDAESPRPYGLNMRVTGEVPKAYKHSTKNKARKDFMKAAPQGIESGSEASDSESMTGVYTPTKKTRWIEPIVPVYDKSSANSDSDTAQSESIKAAAMEKVKKQGVKLFGPLPKPYKSFGVIETKTDALEEAIMEAAGSDGEFSELNRRWGSQSSYLSAQMGSDITRSRTSTETESTLAAVPVTQSADPMKDYKVSALNETKAMTNQYEQEKNVSSQRTVTNAKYEHSTKPGETMTPESITVTRNEVTEKQQVMETGSDYGSEEDIEAYSETPATVIDVEQDRLESIVKKADLQIKTSETQQVTTSESSFSQLSPKPPTAAEAEAQIGETLAKPRTRSGIETLLAGLGPEAQKQILRAQAEQIEMANKTSVDATAQQSKTQPPDYDSMVTAATATATTATAEEEVVGDDSEVAEIMWAKVNRDKNRQQKRHQQQIQQQIATAAVQHKQQQLAAGTISQQQELSRSSDAQQQQQPPQIKVQNQTSKPALYISSDVTSEEQSAKAVSASKLPQSQSQQSLNMDPGAVSMEDLQSIGSETPGSKKKGGFFNLPSIRKKKDKMKGSTESLTKSISNESPRASPKPSPSRHKKSLFGTKKPPPITTDLTASAVTSEIWQEALAGDPVAASEGPYPGQVSGEQLLIHQPKVGTTAEDHNIQETIMGSEADQTNTVKKKGGFFNIGSKRKKKSDSKENLAWAQPYESTQAGQMASPNQGMSNSGNIKTTQKPKGDNIARPPQIGVSLTSPVQTQYGAKFSGDTQLAAQLWAEKQNLTQVPQQTGQPSMGGQQQTIRQQQQKQQHPHIQQKQSNQMRRKPSTETNIDEPYTPNPSLQTAAMASVLGTAAMAPAQKKGHPEQKNTYPDDGKFQPITSEKQQSRKQQPYDDSQLASQLWAQSKPRPAHQQQMNEDNVATGTDNVFAAVPTEEATGLVAQPKTSRKATKQVKIREEIVDDAPIVTNAQPFHAAALASVTANMEGSKQAKPTEKPEIERSAPASIIKPQPMYAKSKKLQTKDDSNIVSQLWSEKMGKQQSVDDSEEEKMDVIQAEVVIHKPPFGASDRKRGTKSEKDNEYGKQSRHSSEEIESTGFRNYPSQPLQDVAMQSIMAGLQYQKPITKAEKLSAEPQNNQKYRPKGGLYGDDVSQQKPTVSGRYGDSQLATQLWSQQRSKQMTSDSEAEADTEDLPMDTSMDSTVFEIQNRSDIFQHTPKSSSFVSPPKSVLTSTPEEAEQHKHIQLQGENEPHAFHAVQKGSQRQTKPPAQRAVPPGYYQKETSLAPDRRTGASSPTGSATTASIDLDNRKQRPRRKGRRSKDEAPKTDTGPVDLNQFNVASQLWMEQVDKNNFQKSKSMLLSVVPQDQSVPDELVRNMPDRTRNEATDELAPQWVIARGRTKKKRKTQFQTPDHYGSHQSFRDRYLSSATSDSELDISSSRPMSPGRQLLLFFRIGSNWRDLAWILFEDVQKDSETLKMIKDIQMQNPGHLTNQVNDMMHRWWRRRGNDATIEELQRALDMIQLGYIREEFYDQTSNITSYVSSDSELDMGEISDADPDVKRLLDEYEFRSMNATFDYDSGTESRTGRSSRPSSRNSGKFRFSSSRESLDDITAERSRKTSFVIVQPQLSNPDYRHETTI